MFLCIHCLGVLAGGRRVGPARFVLLRHASVEEEIGLLDDAKAANGGLRGSTKKHCHAAHLTARGPGAGAGYNLTGDV